MHNSDVLLSSHSALTVAVVSISSLMSMKLPGTQHTPTDRLSGHGSKFGIVTVAQGKCVDVSTSKRLLYLSGTNNHFVVNGINSYLQPMTAIAIILLQICYLAESILQVEKGGGKKSSTVLPSIFFFFNTSLYIVQGDYTRLICKNLINK